MELMFESLTRQDAYQTVGAFLTLSALAWGCNLIASMILNRR